MLTKFRKEEVQVIFLQETHPSSKEHEQFKRYGCNNAFYSSFTSLIGVATLIKNSVKFETKKYVTGKEGMWWLREKWKDKWLQ